MRTTKLYLVNYVNITRKCSILAFFSINYQSWPVNILLQETVKLNNSSIDHCWGIFYTEIMSSASFHSIYGLITITAHILSIKYVPRIMLKTSYVLICIILSTAQWGSSYNSTCMEIISHFVNEEGKRSNNLSLVTLLISRRT